MFMFYRKLVNNKNTIIVLSLMLAACVTMAVVLTAERLALASTLKTWLIMVLDDSQSTAEKPPLKPDVSDWCLYVLLAGLSWATGIILKRRATIVEE